IRRISFSSMMRQASSNDISRLTVTIGLLMQSAAVKSKGLRPFAIVRQTMSRSVITPIGTRLDLLSRTGISPQSLSTIIRATSGKGVSLVQQAGLVVIISLTFICASPFVAMLLSSINRQQVFPAPLGGQLATPPAFPALQKRWVAPALKLRQGFLIHFAHRHGRRSITVQGQ